MVLEVKCPECEEVGHHRINEESEDTKAAIAALRCACCGSPVEKGDVLSVLVSASIFADKSSVFNRSEK